MMSHLGRVKMGRKTIHAFYCDAVGCNEKVEYDFYTELVAPMNWATVTKGSTPFILCPKHLPDLVEVSQIQEQ